MRKPKYGVPVLLTLRKNINWIKEYYFILNYHFFGFFRIPLCWFFFQSNKYHSIKCEFFGKPFEDIFIYKNNKLIYFEYSNYQRLIFTENNSNYLKNPHVNAKQNFYIFEKMFHCERLFITNFMLVYASRRPEKF